MSYSERLSGFNQAISSTNDHVKALKDAMNNPIIRENPIKLGLEAAGQAAGTIGGVVGGVARVRDSSVMRNVQSAFYNKLTQATQGGATKDAITALTSKLNGAIGNANVGGSSVASLVPRVQGSAAASIADNGTGGARLAPSNARPADEPDLAPRVPNRSSLDPSNFLDDAFGDIKANRQAAFTRTGGNPAGGPTVGGPSTTTPTGRNVDDTGPRAVDDVVDDLGGDNRILGTGGASRDIADASLRVGVPSSIAQADTETGGAGAGAGSNTNSIARSAISTDGLEADLPHNTSTLNPNTGNPSSDANALSRAQGDNAVTHSQANSGAQQSTADLNPTATGQAARSANAGDANAADAALPTGTTPASSAGANVADDAGRGLRTATHVEEGLDELAPDTGPLAPFLEVGSLLATLGTSIAGLFEKKDKVTAPTPTTMPAGSMALSVGANLKTGIQGSVGAF